jgi:hypothetical protein
MPKTVSIEVPIPKANTVNAPLRQYFSRLLAAFELRCREIRES